MIVSMLILLDDTRRRASRQSHITTAALPDDGDAVFFWEGTGSAVDRSLAVGSTACAAVAAGHEQPA
jgi:hypothetical protein